MHSFTALADPTRRRIVELLAERELSAGDIVAQFDVSAPAISQHLKVLKEAGLVQVRADGQSRLHSLNPAGFQELDQWMERMRAAWSTRLDALERELRHEDEKLRKSESPRSRTTKSTKTKNT
jgi:DNA-binding transcriptional ArsR family regulator